MSLRERTRPGLGIIEPCLPITANVPPSGPGWTHEIKHDGFRILAWKGPTGGRLITRAGTSPRNLLAQNTIEWSVCPVSSLMSKAVSSGQ
jgi:hypothetical protein